MINAGSIGMPLHFGKVPKFLTERMGLMGDAIVVHRRQLWEVRSSHQNV